MKVDVLLTGHQRLKIDMHLFETLSCAPFQYGYGQTHGEGATGKIPALYHRLE